MFFLVIFGLKKKENQGKRCLETRSYISTFLYKKKESVSLPYQTNGKVTRCSAHAPF